MKNNKIIALTITITLLTGCTGRIVHMENEQGVKIKCEVSMASAMMTGVLVRDGSINSCIRDKEAAGFKVVREE